MNNEKLTKNEKALELAQKTRDDLGVKSLHSILLNCKTICRYLDISQENKWIDLELNGYQYTYKTQGEGLNKVPEYRHAAMIFYNEYGQEIVFDHEMQQILGKYVLNIPMSELESFRNKYMIVKDTGVFDLCNEYLQKNHTISSIIPRVVNAKISPNYIARVINGVTNKINEFLDELIIKLEYSSTQESTPVQVRRTESRLNEDVSDIVEIPKDNFQGITNVFISHRFVPQDQKLAVILRDVLKSKKIGGYLAESNQEYELRLDEKIREKIKNADYVVGIITNHSKDSASVNQELGFALGDKTPLIIMVEKDILHGVLTSPRETEEFTRENFRKHCERIADYILEKGVSNKKFTSINSGDRDTMLDKFTEDGIHYVGIRNAKGKTIQSCTIFCQYQKCDWWNTHDAVPRNIMEGEAANIILPRGFANTNPTITIKSRDETLIQINLREIAHRTSVKWSANDENIELVNRLNTSLSRIRSNLATLYNIFQSFIEYPKNIHVSEEIRLSMSQKNTIVEDTQTVVNQASHIMEVDWIHQLNDLCRLAKNNPGIFGDRFQTIQCENCVGVISQIAGLLKYIPNPPI